MRSFLVLEGSAKYFIADLNDSQMLRHLCLGGGEELTDDLEL